MLEWAIKLSREKQALLLLRGPVTEFDIKHKDCDGLTLLHHATINHLLSVIRLILEHTTKYYISVDIADSRGLTPYIHAKRLGYHEIEQELVKAGACIQVVSWRIHIFIDI